MSRAIRKQSLILAAITGSQYCTDKHTTIIDLTQNFDKVIGASRAPGDGACLKGLPRIVTMQGLIPAAISGAEEYTLVLYCI